MSVHPGHPEAYFLLHQLQNIYFNSNHITKLNKLYWKNTLALNKTTRNLIQKTKRYATLEEDFYSKPEAIEYAISVMYQYLQENLYSDFPTSACRTVRIDPLDFSAYPDSDRDYLAPLLVLAKEINREAKSDPAFKGIVLSNSLASRDYARGYSDLDILVVLDDHAFSSVDKIRDVRKKITSWLTLLFYFDSTQHHPFTILSAVQLNHYYQSILPVLIFERHSKNLVNKTVELSFSCVVDDVHNSIALRHSMSLLREHLRRGGISFWRPYYLKDITSQVTLLVVFFSQHTRGYVYKRDAITRAYLDLTKTDGLKTAEYIRSMFPCIRYPALQCCPTFVHPSVVLAICRKFTFNRPPIHVPLWKRQLFDLLEEIQSRAALR